MKKYVTAGRCLVLTLLCLSASAAGWNTAARAEEVSRADQTQDREGLVRENGNIYFYSKGTRVRNKLKKVGEKYYYFGKNGAAVRKTLQKIHGNIYYFGSDGAGLVNAWKSVKQKGKKYTFYFGKDAKAYKARSSYGASIYKIRGKKYAFDSAGHRLCGAVVCASVTLDEDGEVLNIDKMDLYFFDKKGVLSTSKTKALQKCTKPGSKLTALEKKLRVYGIRRKKTFKEGRGCNNGIDYDIYFDQFYVNVTKKDSNRIMYVNGVYPL